MAKKEEIPKGAEAEKVVKENPEAEVKPQKVSKEPKKTKVKKEEGQDAQAKSPKGKGEKKGEKETKPAKVKPKADENLLYIVRIANRDLDGEKPVKLALSELKGVGMRLAEIIPKKIGISPTVKIGSLGEADIEKLKSYIESKEYAGIPAWLLNHRNETVSGKNFNLVSNDLDVQLQDDINYMRKTRSYKGIRHETGHKVRGQRTRSNGRKGLAVGVIKKKEGLAQPEKKE